MGQEDPWGSPVQRMTLTVLALRVVAGSRAPLGLLVQQSLLVWYGDYSAVQDPQLCFTNEEVVHYNKVEVDTRSCVMRLTCIEMHLGGHHCIQQAVSYTGVGLRCGPPSGARG